MGNILEKTAKIFGAVLLLLPSHGPYPSPNMTALVYRVEGTIKSYAIVLFKHCQNWSSQKLSLDKGKTTHVCVGGCYFLT